MRTFKEQTLLSEEGAGLSRLWHHMQNSDCVIMTAFRAGLSRRENRDRNAQLRFRITKKLGGPIRLTGGYREEKIDEKGNGLGQFEFVTEESFFVPNLHNDQGNLDYLLDLAYHYDQDSIIYIYHPDERHADEKIDKTENVNIGRHQANIAVEAALVGTADGRWIDRGEFQNVGSLTFENATRKIEDMYSEIRGKRFVFTDPADNEAVKEFEESFKRMMKPEGLANAYAKRNFLKKIPKRG